MPRFRLVIFDLDGTLIDSRPDISAAVNRALADHGLAPWPEEAIEPMIGDGARALVERAVDGRLPDAAIDAVLADYHRHYGRDRVVRTTVYPGVLEGLRALAPVARAIATNKPGGLARLIAGDLGLAPLVDAVLGDGDVARRKPAPDMLEAAMARTGVERAATLYVGDSPVDLRTAAGAGVPLCLVSWGYSRGETLAADFAVARFEQLVELVLGS